MRVSKVDEWSTRWWRSSLKRIRSGLGGIETVELLEAARQVMVMNTGRQG